MDRCGPAAPAQFVDDRPLTDVFMSQYDFPVLAVANRLGVFGCLADRPQDAAGTAATLGLDAHGTTVLLSLLVARGFLAVYDGCYHVCAVTRAFLLPGAPYGWGPMLELAWDEKCMAVSQAVREGTARGYGGRGIWETHSKSPRHADQFTAAMHARSRAVAAALAAQPDVADFGTLLDVGGGAGTFAVALAKCNPRLRALVLDLPAVQQVAERTIETAGVGDRVDVRTGDMFGEPWPSNQERVLFADVLCDWGNEPCQNLLARGRDALTPGGRILVAEMLLDDSRSMSPGAAGYAMALACLTGGRLRTLPELGRLLEKAGLVVDHVTPLSGHYSLVTARTS